MKTYKVEIEGVTPYMQKRMDDVSLEQWEKNRKLIIERKGLNDEDLIKAKFYAHLDEKGNPFIPNDHIRGSLINAGSFMKAKVGNARKSMKNIVAGMFYVVPERIPLPKKFSIDKRSAVNRNIKGRIIVIRPRWEKWSAKFNIEVDNDTITTETVKQLLKYAGQYCGIGSFRPTCNGMFGRFKIKSFVKI